MNFNALVDTATEQLGKICNAKGWKAVAELSCNKSIQGEALDDAIKGVHGIAGTVLRSTAGKESISDALKHSFTDEVIDKTGNVTSKMRWGTIAGSYIGASAGYRVLSGGGLYKDKNGNTNLIGLPFI